MLLLKEYIKNVVLLEKNKAEKLGYIPSYETGEPVYTKASSTLAQGGRAPERAKELLPFVKQSPPFYFIHFADELKIGMNPNFDHLTPFGLYAYILTPEIYEKFVVDKLPFAGERHNLYLFEASHPEKLLYLQNVKDVDYFNLQNFIDKNYIEYFPKHKDQLYKNYVTRYGNSLKGAYPTRFWSYLEFLSDGNVKKWRKIILDLGYQGVVDTGNTIYDSEPMQVVMFGSTKDYIRITKVINNPFDEHRYGDDTSKESQWILPLERMKEKEFNEVKPSYLLKIWEKIKDSPSIISNLYNRILSLTDIKNTEEIPYLTQLFNNLLQTQNSLLNIKKHYLTFLENGAKQKLTDHLKMFGDLIKSNYGQEKFEKLVDRALKTRTSMDGMLWNKLSVPSKLAALNSGLFIKDELKIFLASETDKSVQDKLNKQLSR